MFYFLEGEILKAEVPNRVYLAPFSSLALEVVVPFKSFEHLRNAVGKRVKLYTTVFLKQEGYFEVYGFLDEEERHLFLKLLRLSNIGMRLAYNIVSVFSVEQLREIVSNGRVAELSKVPGIGKKRAERIFVDLKSLFPERKTIEGKDQEVIEEAKACLKSLGFTLKEVEPLVFSEYEKGDTIETLLKKILKKLAPQI